MKNFVFKKNVVTLRWRSETGKSWLSNEIMASSSTRRFWAHGQLEVGWGPFLKNPETFRAHFGWHNSGDIILFSSKRHNSLFFKTKGSRGTKLRSYFNFYSLYNIWTDQLYRLSRSEFHEWFFGPEKFSGLSRNGPLAYSLWWKCDGLA